ncbi:MAG TPA: adenosine deaminase [Pseudonocardiaceae bacterium]|jgi:aminodeoxyfutalosine deaminase|nr:adenosine deaminase [Pseudonocardiaceae bacterium]
MSDISEFVTALPKTELHLHLVGSASPETVLELSRNHPEAGLPTELDKLVEFYTFRDFPHFIEIYKQVDSMVRTAEDVRTLLHGLAKDAAASNVRYAEVTVTAGANLEKEMSVEDLASALESGRAAAKAEFDLTLNWIFDIPAGLPDQQRVDTVDFALHARPLGTVALGLAGLEVGYPRRDFVADFDKAIAAGLHRVVHAGETTGPEEVWDAIHVLHAERIGHGVGAAQDPELLAYLRDNDITVEMCPTSNICTRAVDKIADHPLPILLEHGVPVTLSTDDPGMFNTNLNQEYLLVAETFGLARGQLAEMAKAGVRAAYCDETLREELLGEIDAVRDDRV